MTNESGKTQASRAPSEANGWKDSSQQAEENQDEAIQAIKSAIAEKDESPDRC